VSKNYFPAILKHLKKIFKVGPYIDDIKLFIRPTNAHKRRINNQLDADKLRFIDVISSTCFGYHYAHHQEYRSETTDRL
jgi:hypothetical protein